MFLWIWIPWIRRRAGFQVGTSLVQAGRSFFLMSQVWVPVFHPLDTVSDTMFDQGPMGWLKELSMRAR